jgi:hypothetical protein
MLGLRGADYSLVRAVLAWWVTWIESWEIKEDAWLSYMYQKISLVAICLTSVIRIIFIP